jgi:hypothetical protein
VARAQKKWGRKRSFQIGLVVACLSALLCAYALIQSNFWLLNAATVIAGFYNANGLLYRFTAAELAGPTSKEKAVSWVLAGVWKLIELLHGQGVHIGTQTDSPVARAVFNNAHNPRGAHAAVDRYSPFSQLGRDQVSGALLLKAQFWMRMDVASHSADAGGLGDK